MSSARSRSPLDGAPVGSVVAGVAADELHAERRGRRAARRRGRAGRRARRRSPPPRTRAVDRPASRPRPSAASRGCTGNPSSDPAVLGDRSVVVECIEHAQQLVGRLHRLRRWRIEERQVARLHVPRCELERQTGEVDLGDLGREVGEPRALLELAPQPVADARLGSAGASRRVDRLRRDSSRPSSADSCRCARRSVEPARGRRRRRPARPQTVSDDSAMSVLSTTRRRPAGDGCSASSCSASDSAPASGYTSTWSGRRPLSNDSTRRISPMPGRNTRTSPTSSRSAVTMASVTAASTRTPLAMGSERMSTGCWRPSLSTMGTGPSTVAAQHACQLRAVGCGRHGQDAQVGSQRGACVQREGQAEVGRQVALVHLVEDDDAHTGQLGVVSAGVGSALPRSPPRCASIDRCAARHESGSRRCHRPARRERRHPVRGRASRQPARLEHDDALGAQPRLVEQPQRHDGGLAGTGRCDEDGAVSIGQCACPGGRATSMTGRSATASGNEPGIAAGYVLRRRSVVRRAPACRGTGRGRWQSAGTAAIHAVVVAIASATSRHSAGSSLRRRPARCRRTGRTRTPAGSARPSPFTKRAVRVAEDEEVVGERTEEGARLRARAGEHEVDPCVAAAECRSAPEPRSAGSTSSRSCTGRGRRWPGGTSSAIPRADERRRRARSARCPAKGSWPRRTR